MNGVKFNLKIAEAMEFLISGHGNCGVEEESVRVLLGKGGDLLDNALDIRVQYGNPFLMTGSLTTFSGQILHCLDFRQEGIGLFLQGYQFRDEFISQHGKTL